MFFSHIILTLNTSWVALKKIQRVQTSIPKESYSFVIFQGESGPTVPPLNLRMTSQ